MYYEHTPEDSARLAKYKPTWVRDPDLRNANLFGDAITGASDVARYNVVDDYIVARFYTNHREGAPSPSYGLYEDLRIRLAFQYIEVAPSEIALGRSDLDVASRPPGLGRELFENYFAEVPRPCSGISTAEHAEIRERIRLVLSQWGWPYKSGPDVVRDARPGEIYQGYDAGIRGVVR